MDIKESLKKGVSVDDLRSDFNAELAKAQEELDKETKVQANIEAKRQTLIDAVEAYFEALDFVSENDSKSFNKALTNWLKNLEKRDVRITHFHPRDLDPFPSWWNYWL